MIIRTYQKKLQDQLPRNASAQQLAGALEKIVYGPNAGPESMPIRHSDEELATAMRTARSDEEGYARKMIDLGYRRCVRDIIHAVAKKAAEDAHE